MAKRDRLTPDLFDWQRQELVKRFDDAKVRAATLRARIAHAVSETLKNCAKPRVEVAESMSAWLQEDVTVNMLNAYASEARDAHTIPFIRLIALVHATDDLRLLQMAAEMFGHSVIDDRYLPWVDVGQLADKKLEIDRNLEAARRNARRGARR